jgi:kynurenine formamidase
MAFVELNHPLREGMPVGPGLQATRIGAVLTHKGSRQRYEEKGEFFVGTLDMRGNPGTSLDAPSYRFPCGQDLASVPLEAVAGLPGLSIDASSMQGREIRLSLDRHIVRGRAVLIRTGWDERWGTECYRDPGPYLAEDLVDILVRGKAWLVGVDCANVDDTEDSSRPVHNRLLAEGILIVEHLCNLGRLSTDGFRFYAVPLRIVGGASFPVRAFAELA